MGATTAVKNSAALVPCVFAYNGGIHPEFDATLVKMFGQTEIEHIFTWGGNLRDAVHYARQTTTASIVNSHAQYYIRNQKRAFQTRGHGTELRWWASAEAQRRARQPDEDKIALAAEAARVYGTEDEYGNDEAGDDSLVTGNGGGKGFSMAASPSTATEEVPASDGRGRGRGASSHGSARGGSAQGGGHGAWGGGRSAQSAGWGARAEHGRGAQRGGSSAQSGGGGSRAGSGQGVGARGGSWGFK